MLKYSTQFAIIKYLCACGALFTAAPAFCEQNERLDLFMTLYEEIYFDITLSGKKAELEKFISFDRVETSMPTAQDSTTPEVTTPEVTTPEVTTPEVTTPEITTPEVTTPEVTTPEVTTPEITTPEVTTPEITTPEVTTPEITTPEVTPPEITTPEVTTSENTTPENPPAGDMITVTVEWQSGGIDNRKSTITTTSPATLSHVYYLFVQEWSGDSTPLGSMIYIDGITINDVITKNYTLK